jgi:uncharacterized membrane protein YhiD involved in acid resistance
MNEQLMIIIGIMGILALLIALILATALYRVINRKQEYSNPVIESKESSEKIVLQSFPKAEPKRFTAEDITDEDMMAAALVAAIAYQEETKKDVRLLSIRQIA